MDFHKQYRSMNENITPSDALVQQTIAKMESGRPHRARKPLKIILAVAAALACVSTAVAANQEAVLRVLYQIAPGMAEYLQPVGQVCEDRGVKLEVVSADVEGSTAKVYLSLTDTTGSVFGDAAPDMYDSWHLDIRAWAELHRCPAAARRLTTIQVPTRQHIFFKLTIWEEMFRQARSSFRLTSC